jgi:hypothetical protein
MPGFITHYHLDQYIARKHLALHCSTLTLPSSNSQALLLGKR